MRVPPSPYFPPLSFVCTRDTSKHTLILSIEKVNTYNAS